jgi:release factor glutamine methyltransferase
MVVPIANMTTIKELLQESSALLKHNGIESPSLVAELLLRHVLAIRKGDLSRIRDNKPGDSEKAHFNLLLKRASDHEPVQYILGETEFMGLRFHVDKRVLIPRPDTEILVEKVIELSKRADPNLMVLDIGTGSGNITISLAKFLPNIRIDAIDISEDALHVAADNIHHHGLEARVNAFKCDIRESLGALHPPYDVIVSNPPYISAEEYKVLPRNVRNYEPQEALFDGGDGLSFYRRIASVGKSLLRKGGLVAVEIGYNQSSAVSDLFKKESYQDIAVTRDYSGIERVVTARRT